MSEEKIVPKILINLEEFERLQAFEKAHQNCTTESQQPTIIPEETRSGAAYETGCGETQWQRIVETIGQEVARQVKSVIDPLSKPQAGYVEYDTQIQPQLETVDVVKSKLSDEEEIAFAVKKVRKKFQPEARKLLSRLSKDPTTFMFDNNGLIFIDQQPIHGSSIYQLIPLVFYQLKRHNSAPGEVDLYNLLQRLDLKQFIKNKHFGVSKGTADQNIVMNDMDWYYLGV